MFEHLVFRPGLTVSSERDRAQVLMQAIGLRSADDDLRRGLDAVAAWVTGGRRVVGPDDVNRVIDDIGLRTAEPKAVLLVQAIDRDPHPEDATYSVDWVELYEGETPAVRCRPRTEADWARMAAELRAEAQRLEVDGWRNVLVRGAMRQATFFLVGACLPAVRGMTLTYLQGREPWSTGAAGRQVRSLERRTVEVKTGADLAVAVGVAVDPADAVTEYVRTSRLTVDRLAVLTPDSGANDQAVRNAGDAVAYACATLCGPSLSGLPTRSGFTCSSPGPAAWRSCSVTAGTACAPPSCTSTSASAGVTRPPLPSTLDPDAGCHGPASAAARPAGVKCVYGRLKTW